MAPALVVSDDKVENYYQLLYACFRFCCIPIFRKCCTLAFRSQTCRLRNKEILFVFDNYANQGLKYQIDERSGDSSKDMQKQSLC